MASETLSTNVPRELVAELRATAKRTGIPMARIVRDGIRLRLDQLDPRPERVDVPLTDAGRALLRAGDLPELSPSAYDRERKSTTEVR